MQELRLNINDLPFSGTAVTRDSILAVVQKLRSLTITEWGFRHYREATKSFVFTDSPLEDSHRFYLLSYKFGAKAPVLEFHPAVKRLVSELERFGAILNFGVNHSTFDAWFNISTEECAAYYCLSSNGFCDFELTSSLWCKELTSAIARKACLLDNMLYAMVLWCGVPKNNETRWWN